MGTITLVLIALLLLGIVTLLLGMDRRIFDIIVFVVLVVMLAGLTG